MERRLETWVWILESDYEQASFFICKKDFLNLQKVKALIPAL